MDRCDVVIAGAGVGGLACALALAHEHRLRVVVVERRAGPGYINRGDSLLPTVVAKFARWGVFDRLIAAGARPVSTIEVHHSKSGLLMAAPLPRDERHPYLVLPHPEIERVLTEAAIATGLVEIRHRCRVTRIAEEGGRVRGLELQREGGAEERVEARLLVGADGASSVVRAALGIPLACAPYDHDFFVVDLERPAGYRDAMRIELHPDGGALVVPGVDRVGVAVLVRPAHEPLFRAGPIDEKLAEIARRVPLLAGCRSARGAHLYKLSRGHADRYVARGAVLLGDAVHVTNPTAGQGMTMAIGDAASLSAHVGPALAAGNEPRALDGPLAAYEEERRAANASRLRWSHWMSRFYALSGDAGDAIHRGLFSLGGSAFGRAVLDRIWSRVASHEATPAVSLVP